MGWNQIIFGVALVVVLLALAGFYAWRQILLLRRVPAAVNEESEFQRGLAHRRLVNSGLLGLLAVLLVGALLFLENPAQQLADQQDARERAGQETKLSQSDRDFGHTYAIYWIVFLLVLLASVVLAGMDVWAIRRYALRQFRKLREARREMIEQETARMRQERTGPDPDDVLRN